MSDDVYDQAATRVDDSDPLPYRPDRSLITYIEKGRSKEERDAILREGEGDPPYSPDHDLIIYRRGGTWAHSWVTRLRGVLARSVRGKKPT